jgi:hypothetical protein
VLETQSGGDLPPVDPKWTTAQRDAAIASYRESNLQTLLDNAVRRGYPLKTWR